MAKLGGNIEICCVCSDKVYPLDKFVIEKLVMHKSCFKCKHCDRKLGLTNFAAVNSQVYCKAHYLKLFRESGGKYDKAFGDGGFQKKSSTAYTPGQFAGVGKQKPSAVPSHVMPTPDMSPVITAAKVKVPVVSKARLVDDDEDDRATDEEPMAASPQQKSPSIKDIVHKYEASLRDASSAGSESDEQSSPRSKDSPVLNGDVESRMKWLTGVSASSTAVKKNATVDDKPGGSIAERKAAYLASVSDTASPPTSRLRRVATAEKSDSAKARTAFEAINNFPNQPKMSETGEETSPAKSRVEVDRTPGGTTAARKDAYLAATSSSSPSPQTSGSKKVSKLVKEKMEVFVSPPTPPRQHVQASSPGRIDDKLKTFVDAASSSSPAGASVASSASSPSIGKIDDRRKLFEDAAKGSGGRTHEEEYQEAGEAPSEESRQRTNAIVQTTPPKVEPGHGGAPIRSFNEGANASLRRTPSWLRMQRMMEESDGQASEPISESFPPAITVDTSLSTVMSALALSPTNASSSPVVGEEEKGTPVRAATGESASNEEDEEGPSTPVYEELASAPPPSGSIMKRAGSFKKDRSATPAEKRTVKFGNAEIHNLPSSPQTPDSPGSGVVRSSSSHSASKGSALAVYLKAMENGGSSRKRPQEEVTEGHASHVDSPPPPILSPGSRAPSYTPSSLSYEVPREDLLSSPDEALPPSTLSEKASSAADETSEEAPGEASGEQ